MEKKKILSSIYSFLASSHQLQKPQNLSVHINQSQSERKFKLVLIQINDFNYELALVLLLLNISHKNIINVIIIWAKGISYFARFY